MRTRMGRRRGRVARSSCSPPTARRSAAAPSSARQRRASLGRGRTRRRGGRVRELRMLQAYKKDKVKIILPTRH